MSSVRNKPIEIREAIENNTMRIMRALMRENSHINKKASKFQKIIKALRERNLIISKADKSNHVMVMDREYYEQVARMKK